MKTALQLLAQSMASVLKTVFIFAIPFLCPYVYTVCKRSTVEHGAREGNATAYTNQTVWERELKKKNEDRSYAYALRISTHSSYKRRLMKMELIICNAVQQQHIPCSDPTDQ